MTNSKYDISNAKCVIKLCVVLCAFFIGSALWYYFNYLHTTCSDENILGTWYNFLSPIIAVANIVAFIGLTAAIFFGENSQHQQREKIHIEDAMLSKLYNIERDLVNVDTDLRLQDPSIKNVYSAYLVVYRGRYYFEQLKEVETLSEDEKADAGDMRDAFEEKERQLRESYILHRNNGNPYSEDEIRSFTKSINHLIGMLNMMETHIMQQMAKSVNYQEATTCPE